MLELAVKQRLVYHNVSSGSAITSLMTVIFMYGGIHLNVSYTDGYGLGSSTCKIVPPSPGDSTCIVPPNSATRSLMPSSPKCLDAESSAKSIGLGNPRPSSASRIKILAVAVRSTRKLTRRACACLRMLFKPSCTMRNTDNSSASGKRPNLGSMLRSN